MFKTTFGEGTPYRRTLYHEIPVSFEVEADHITIMFTDMLTNCEDRDLLAEFFEAVLEVLRVKRVPVNDALGGSSARELLYTPTGFSLPANFIISRRKSVLATPETPEVAV